jgi:hypothetical protein
MGKAMLGAGGFLHSFLPMRMVMRGQGCARGGGILLIGSVPSLAPRPHSLRSMHCVGDMALMLTGGFRSARAMAAALRSGSVDIIGLARPFATDHLLIPRLFGPGAWGTIPPPRCWSRRFLLGHVVGIRGVVDHRLPGCASGCVSACIGCFRLPRCHFCLFISAAGRVAVCVAVCFCLSGCVCAGSGDCSTGGPPSA